MANLFDEKRKGLFGWPYQYDYLIGLVVGAILWVAFGIWLDKKEVQMPRQFQRETQQRAMQKTTNAQ